MRSALAIVAAALCSTACAQGTSAVATLAPTAGNSAAGTVSFAQQGETILVTVDMTGLKPGPHGFHVHEKGDCSAPDATSAGGHFNPTGQPHGDPKGASHHLGDMPMLVADASGNAKLKFEFGPATLRGGPYDIVGRSVVVHADADDFRTQPAGNSGARIACGVIK
ncbi:MAG TPA: superoxide dismutase family protein [Casimicrobiaceae bacterium]|nr:superoxide dismutase family protein [Casimicrobiaceae bacterium]